MMTEFFSHSFILFYQEYDSDEGLRKKFFTALEDLRIHGPPGISRHPGPSHISYQWICDIWLKHHLGLVQLIPIFSIRRVDGRMLSSLITYKRSKYSIQHKNRRKSKDNHNYDNDNCYDIIISNPNDDIPLSNYSQQDLINLKTNEINGSSNNNDNISNHSSVKSISSVSSTSSITNAVQDSCSHNNSSNKYDNGNEYMERNWQVAGRKEMLHILLGLSHTSSSSSSSSGADLSVDSRYLLGKKEAESLRTAIELLYHHNFNIELIEQIRAKSDLSELDLLYWTNDHIVKWLSDLGLSYTKLSVWLNLIMRTRLRTISDFVHGIDASGLHGAYMVLDSTFDFNTLIKRLHIPLNVAVLCKLEENLQRILKPAR
uniref:Kazrin n=1 Tax=Schistosoma haematobium TaxID=6185 RepID=A0A095AY77_SCHHA